MSEDDDTMEFGLGVSLAVRDADGKGVTVLSIEALDAPGTFRVRRGETSLDAYRAETRLVRMDRLGDPFEWGPLADTGLEVKINQMPPEYRDLRIGVRRAVTS